MQNVTIQGFTVGYGENARIPSSEVQWLNPHIYNNGVGMNLFDVAEEQIIGGTFYGNGNHIQSGDANSQPEIHITGTYFIAHSNEAFAFTNTTLGGTIYLTDVHLENGANPTINAHYVEGNVSVFGKGGVAEDDSSSGTSDWWFKPTGAAFVWDAIELVTGTRNPTVGVLNLAGNTRAKLRGFVLNPGNANCDCGWSECRESHGLHVEWRHNSYRLSMQNRSAAAGWQWGLLYKNHWSRHSDKQWNGHRNSDFSSATRDHHYGSDHHRYCNLFLECRAAGHMANGNSTALASCHSEHCNSVAFESDGWIDHSSSHSLSLHGDSIDGANRRSAESHTNLGLGRS
jgi:hypothetical protein